MQTVTDATDHPIPSMPQLPLVD